MKHTNIANIVSIQQKYSNVSSIFISYVPFPETSNPRIIDGEHVQSRIRSNSAESWESTSANNMLETARHHWSRRQDDTERKRNINGNDDSIYVDTTRSSDENAIIVEKGSRSQQQDDYTQIIKTEHG